jgi:hypothetical protein
MATGNSAPAPSVPFEVGEFSTRSLGVTVNLPARLGDHFRYMSAVTLGGDPVPVRLQFLEDFLKKFPDDDARFIGLCYGTVAGHELRHFHDFLATTYGAFIMAEHMLAISYLFVVMAAMSEEPTIGVPLQAWAKLPEELHDAYRRETKSGMFSRTPPDITTRFTEIELSILDRIKRWRGTSPAHFPDWLATSHLVEATAIEVQATHMREVFGSERLAFFCNYLRNIDTERTYTIMWDFWDTISKQSPARPHFSSAVRNAIAFFALCPPLNSKPTDPLAHPTGRFFSLVGYLASRRWVPHDEDVLNLINGWAEKAGLPGLTEALTASAIYQEQFVQRLRIICKENAEVLGENIYPEGFLRACEALASAHKHMVTAVLSNPLRYFDPEYYIEDADRWVAAPQYIATDTTMFSGPMFEDAEQRGWRPVVSRQGKAGVYHNLLYHPLTSPGQQILPPDLAGEFSIYVWMTYWLWSYGMLSSVHRQAAATVWRTGRPEQEILLL